MKQSFRKEIHALSDYFHTKPVFWFSFKVSYIYDNRLFLYNRLCAEELSKKNSSVVSARNRGSL